MQPTRRRVMENTFPHPLQAAEALSGSHTVGDTGVAAESPLTLRTRVGVINRDMASQSAGSPATYHAVEMI